MFLFQILKLKEWPDWCSNSPGSHCCHHTHLSKYLSWCHSNCHLDRRNIQKQSNLLAQDTCGYSEESEEGHSKCSEVCMLPQTLTWVLVITAKATKHLNTQGRENKEQKEEEKALKLNCYICIDVNCLLTQISHLR